MSKLSYVSPQVLVANSIYDPIADDGVTAFNKYNVHYHNPVVSADFLSYDLEIGDEVYLYNQDGSEVIQGPDPAVINYITSKEIRISSTILESITNGFLYYKQQRGVAFSKVIPGISASINSQIITFTDTYEILDTQQRSIRGVAGYITPNAVSSLSRCNVSALLVTKSGRMLYPVIPTLGFKGWLIGLGVYSIDTVTNYRVAYSVAGLSGRTVISQDINPIYNGSLYHTLMYDDEDIESYSLNSYPTWRSQEALPASSTVYIEFLTQPVAGAHLNLSFIFNKVIY